jgi:hypothetical protein
LNWGLSWQQIILAWSPVVLFALIRCTTDRRRLGWNEGFLAIAFFIAFMLSIHDRFTDNPVQPAHFTRGYVWMPLVLLAMPWIQRTLIVLDNRIPKSLFIPFAALLFSVAVFDNAVFVSRHVVIQLHADGELGISGPQYFVSADERDLLMFADEQEFDGVIAASDARLSYLAATYTRLRPYVGHPNHTPDMARRLEHIDQFFSHGRYASVGWLNPIDFLIVSVAESRELPSAILDEWSLIYRNDSYSLYLNDRDTDPAR